ncbi:protein aurora borealis isoform X2 [Takifugu rubripes]|uniref:protein aurora borealis isoform X2 n=1 Tax=Takifugu rubripes TaxID=31033 RepID=UPI0005D14720|nr:protein aurora borealis isoform X2 [Takifugu rubripes]|eukprot:XP_011601275.1 PREDICTED: protein aurora borealis isoform X2 [Takifugu rubripes]
MCCYFCSFCSLLSAKMGDHVEITSQITPETPGRPFIRNPFESPNDYHHLREALVPSPSVFKSKPCKSTPPKFDWSIEEMASLLPIHIDQEEIQLQSFCLSQTRLDSDIEEKRQNAIEQFFTKGTIVPSPWATTNTRKTCQIKMKSCGSVMIAEEPEKTSVACQTTLSLPLTFDLEKVLGDYYRHAGEASDAVQESLSSSSLRRKLFLDGQGSYSGSDSSGPPTPERSYTRQESPPLKQVHGAAEEEAVSSVIDSPLACGRLALTPSTGQFSSSPIQNGCFRDCSLGSITSPLFPDRSSPAGLSSPTVSPIVAYATNASSSADSNQPSSVTPYDVHPSVNMTPCTERPFVEGCSPIHSCSPHHLQSYSEHQNGRPKPRLRLHSRLSPPLISPILNPNLPDHQRAEDLLPFPSSSSFPPMDLDPSSPLGHNPQLDVGEKVAPDPLEPLKMEEDKQNGMAGRLEDEEEESGESSGHLTSSRMGNMSGTDSTHMCVSVLMEGSSLRYDSSMQVDSGYNTTSAGANSLTDSESHCKESFSSNLLEEAFQIPRHLKVKVFYPHL